MLTKIIKEDRAVVPRLHYLRQQLPRIVHAFSETKRKFPEKTAEQLLSTLREKSPESTTVLNFIFNGKLPETASAGDVLGVLRFYVRLFEGGFAAHELTCPQEQCDFSEKIYHRASLSVFESDDAHDSVEAKTQTLIAAYGRMQEKIQKHMDDALQLGNKEYWKYMMLFSHYGRDIFRRFLDDENNWDVALLQREVARLNHVGSEPTSTAHIADMLFREENSRYIQQKFLQNTTAVTEIHTAFMEALKGENRAANKIHYYFTFSQDLLALKEFLLSAVAEISGITLPPQEPICGERIVLKRLLRPMADMLLYPDAQLFIVNSVHSPQWPNSMLIQMARYRQVRVISCVDSTYAQLREFILNGQDLPINPLLRQFTVCHGQLLPGIYQGEQAYAPQCAVHDRFTYTLPHHEQPQTMIFEHVVTSLEQCAALYKTIGFLRLETLLNSAVMADPTYAEVFLILAQALSITRDMVRVELKTSVGEQSLYEQVKALIDIARLVPEKKLDIIVPGFLESDAEAFFQMYERCLDNRPVANMQFTLFIDKPEAAVHLKKNYLRDLLLYKDTQGKPLITTILLGTTSLEQQEPYRVAEQKQQVGNALAYFQRLAQELRSVRGERTPLSLAILGTVASDEIYLRLLAKCFSDIAVLEVLTNNEYVRLQTYLLFQEYRDNAKAQQPVPVAVG